MRTEWFAGLWIAGALLGVVPTADAQDPETPESVVSAASPFAEMEPLSGADMNGYAGGANTVVVEQGSLMLNDTTAAGTASNNVLSDVTSGFAANNLVSQNAGFTTVITNTGNANGIAVNTSVIINLQ